jgi:hypothetical protein
VRIWLSARWIWGGIFIAATLVAPDARATPQLRLVYIREQGTESCPEEMNLRMSVASRLGYDPFSPTASGAIVARLSRREEALSGSVEIIDEQGISRGRRELESRDDRCDELSRAMALSISIAVDPEYSEREEEEPPPPSQPVVGVRPLNPVVEDEGVQRASQGARDRAAERYSRLWWRRFGASQAASTVARRGAPRRGLAVHGRGGARAPGYDAGRGGDQRLRTRRRRGSLLDRRRGATVGSLQRHRPAWYRRRRVRGIGRAAGDHAAALRHGGAGGPGGSDPARLAAERRNRRGGGMAHFVNRCGSRAWPPSALLMMDRGRRAKSVGGRST